MENNLLFKALRFESRNFSAAAFSLQNNVKRFKIAVGSSLVNKSSMVGVVLAPLVQFASKTEQT